MYSWGMPEIPAGRRLRQENLFQNKQTNPKNTTTTTNHTHTKTFRLPTITPSLEKGGGTSS